MPRKHSQTSSGGQQGGAGTGTEVLPRGGREVGSPGAARQEAKPGFIALPKWYEQFSIIPVAIAIAVSLNCLANGFAADDQQQILSNAFIKDLGNLPKAFTNSVWTFASDNIVFTVDRYYRPLFNVLLSVNYAIFGSSPRGWHLVNVLIDAGVAYLVFLVLRKIVGSNWVALIASVLFAAHPVHAESIAWISGMTDPLMALFALPSFLAYLRYRQTRERWALVVFLALLLLSLLCKETAIALPVLVGCCEMWLFDEDPLTVRVKRAAILSGLMAIPILVYLGMRLFALSGVSTTGSTTLPISVTLLTLPRVVVEYLRIAFVPQGYSYMHFVAPVTSLLNPAALGCAALLVGLAALIAARGSRLVRFSALFFILWLAPALAAIRGFDPEFMVQERYLYLSSAGSCLLIALGLGWLWKSRGSAWRHAFALSLMLAITIIFLATHVRQNAVWSNDISLYQNCVVQDRSLISARATLGSVYFQAGRVKEGEAEERQAMDQNPQAPDPYVALSSFANAQGRIDRAISYLQDGIKAVPETPETAGRLATMYLNLGMFYERQKDYDRAESAMLQSVRLWRRPVGLYYLGQLYTDEGRYQQALAVYQEALGRLPMRYGPIHLKLAHVYEELGDKEHARSEYQAFIDFSPDADAKRDAARRLSQL